MADYFAVLSRTLAGFGEPKPELREKLYERARMTIRRQLDSHTPPLDDAALAAEMDKLEEAIRKVESDFGPPNVDLAPLKAEVSKASQDKSEAEDAKPASDKAEKDKPEAAGKPADSSKKQSDDPVKSEPAKAQPAKPKSDKAAPAKEKKGFLGRRKKKAETVKTPEPAAKSSSITDEGKKPSQADTDSKKPESVSQSEPKSTKKDVKEAGSEPPAVPPKDKKENATEKPATKVASSESPDPEDEWAREFLDSQKTSKPEVAEALGELQAERVKAKEENNEERAAAIAATAISEATAAKKPAPDLPGFSDTPDESLTIPSATQTKSQKKSGGLLKWVLIILLLVLLGGGLFVLVNWEDRAEIAARFGMDGLFGGTVKPTPVKTIKITPPEEPEDAPAPDPEAAPETPSPANEPDVPKTEDRLTGEDTVEEPLTPLPSSPETPPAETTETGEPEQQPGTDVQTPAPQLPAVDAGAVPAIAQSAILYEEGGSPSDNSFDTGGVVWSVVQEQGGEGEGNIPAIRARVEVPSRQLVLIMTIKRNSDRALPASHLIELVFAVPDDFSGGSIQAINRFVLKQTEQDRGQALIGVPARISDGIFLIALNNLDAAQQNNEQLLTSRSWIDIPLQYRTGRRALVTLEKGLPGDAVFKEVFEAWEKLDAQP